MDGQTPTIIMTTTTTTITIVAMAEAVAFNDNHDGTDQGGRKIYRSKLCLFGQRTRRGRCPIEHGGISVQAPAFPPGPERPFPGLGPAPLFQSSSHPSPTARLPLESPGPPRTDRNSPLCSIGHRPLRVRCPKSINAYLS